MASKLVSAVVSTRKKNEEYLKHVTRKFGEVDILCYENEGTHSLASLYNKGLDEAKTDIVVFMHDDLMLNTVNISRLLHRLFKQNPDYGIIGVAGTVKLQSGMWWQDTPSMMGQVRHRQGDREWVNGYSRKFGDNLKSVVIVDGLFFAVHKQRIKERFDEDFPGFHFYDIPFCVSNYIKGVKVGVTTLIDITHFSIGQTNKQWEKNKLFFEAKYGENLPIIANMD